MSVVRQCASLSIHRSGLYYKPCQESEVNLDLMELIDKQYQETPFYGVLRMTAHLNREGYEVNEKRIRRLYKLMALRAIYPGPKTSIANQEHEKYPYLLGGLQIVRRNQVWASDITYIPMKKGFLYLVAIIDLYSRYVVGWGISNTLDADFCIEVLEESIRRHGRPEIFNTDQGSQYTCKSFISVLKEKEVQISMDGKGRAIDNIFIERLWRSVKYECVYLHEFANGIELYEGVKKYFDFYNQNRVHQGIDYKVPADLYLAAA